MKKKKTKKRWFVLKDNALYSYKAPSVRTFWILNQRIQLLSGKHMINYIGARSCLEQMGANQGGEKGVTLQYTP